MTGSRLLALDIGGKRIGVAISDELGMIASPLTMIPAAGDVTAELKRLVETYAIGRVVVGLPVGLSGREGPQAQQTRAVVAELAAAVNIPFVFADERLTSAIAEQALMAQGTRRDKRKDHIDAMAASVILQGYLDQQRWNPHQRR